MSDSFSAVIFDLDGTLIDSNGAWKQIDIDYAKSFGVTLTDDEANAAAAMTYDVLLKFLNTKGISITESELCKSINKMAYDSYARTIPAKKNASALVKSVKQSGAKVALCTGTPAELHVPTLERLGIMDCFDIRISTDMVGGIPKSRPDALLRTIRELDVPPQSCIMLDDSPDALRVTASMGIYTVAVYDAYTNISESEYLSVCDRYVSVLPENMVQLARICSR